MQTIYNTYNETLTIHTGILSLNNLSGIVNLSGVGNISIFTGENIILISGNNIIDNLDNYVLTNQTGNFGTIFQIQQTNNLLYDVLDVLSGKLDGSQTGDLTTIFYPLQNNPSGYITASSLQNCVYTNATGDFVTTYKIDNTGIVFNTKIDNLSGDFTSNYVRKNETGNFLTINTYPQTTIKNLSGILYFQKRLISGLSDQYINFPQFIGHNTIVTTTIYQSGNNLNKPFILSTISGITSGGFWLRCSDTINDNEHFVNGIAISVN